MVDRLAGALPEFGQDAPVSVIRVISYDRSNTGHQFLILFAGAVGTTFPVIVGALRQADRLKALVQSALLSVLIHEANLLGRGQLSPKNS